MNTSDPADRRGVTAPRRRIPIVASVAALCLSTAVLAAPVALADDGPYSVDGTVPDASVGAIPEAFLPDLYGSNKELGPQNGNTTKIGVIHSDPLPTLDYTNPNGQVDLRGAWLDIAKDDTGDDWLYFAWERDANKGSGFIAYEFMQNAAPVACAYGSVSDEDLIANCNPWANRDGDTDGAGPDVGDFMILWDQQGNTPELFLRKWTGTAPNLTLEPPQQLNSTVSAAAYSPDGFRGEAAVNLTDTIFGGVSSCLSFANTIPSTVTGNSDTADYKDTILATAPPISNCETTTVTTPKKANGDDISGGVLSIGTGVVGVKDSAEVTLTGGTATPAGSVAFWLCKLDSGLCTTGGTSVGSVSLSGASYPATVVSPTAYVTEVGRYCWRAVFSGDTTNGIPGSSDSRESECFTVTPVTPMLGTTAGGDVLVGQAVSDSATLTGTATQPADPVINLSGTAGAAATGTITFTLYGPDDCSTVAYTSDAVSVSGDGTYNTPTPGFTPQEPGTYHWVAEYSGSSPNTNGTTHNASCNDTGEDVVVSTVASSLFTEQSWVPNDSATVSAPAGGALAGSVKFEFFANATCTGTPEWDQTVAVSGSSPQKVSTTNSTAISATGSFSWQVTYDSTNDAQRDIPASCHETSALTVTNGGTVSSP